MSPKRNPKKSPLKHPDLRMANRDALIDRLFSRRADGIKPGLEVMLDLLETLGNPHRGVSVIHVAGTNGKGTVCALMESVLRAAGARTGLYTSPHLLRFNERFRVNGCCIADDDLEALIREVEEVAGALEAKGMRGATFFELSTAIAYLYFERQGVDIALVETGMGGVWDATNVIVPVMSIITSVGMDHMEYLGDDLEGIAREKSGIIKPGRPVVTGKLNELAGGVVRRKAAELDAPLVQAGDRVSVERKRGDLFGQRIKAESQSGAYGPMELPLAGRYQLENCAVALAALEVLGDCAGFTLKPETVRRGVEGVRWPGRCEVVARDPVVLLDGAHNVDGAKRLARVVRDDAPGPVAMVLGLLEEKDAGGIAGILGPVAERIWLVEVASPRAMSLDTMKAAFIRVEKKVEGACLQEALDAARKWAKERNGMVCVAGSLYLLGEVYKWLGYDPFREATGVSGP